MKVKNKSTIIICVLAILLLIVLIVYFINRQNIPKEEVDSQEIKPSGSTEIIESENREIEIPDGYVSEKFLKVANELLKQDSMKNAKVINKNKLKDLYNINNDDYDGMLIVKDDKSNYEEIALIYANSQENSDNLLLGMMNRFQYIRDNSLSDLAYDTLNINMTKESGIIIFILSKDKDNLYNIISKNCIEKSGE